MRQSPIIHWFRRDLRLRDNTSLHHAIQQNAPILPVFIFDTALLNAQRIGTPRMAFLLSALHALDESLKGYGSRLLVRFGAPVNVLAELIQQTKAQALHFNRDVSPYALTRDEQISRELIVPVHGFDDALLLPPNDVLKTDGKPYRVYTPYRNVWNKIPKPAVLETVFSSQSFYPQDALTRRSIPTLEELGHPKTIATPRADENTAQDFLNAFLADDIHHYSKSRNTLPISPFTTPRPNGTSYLSPYLRLGVLSPRECYWQARDAYASTPSHAYRESIETWVNELTWRDFYGQIVFHFPHVLKRDFVDTYLDLEWRNDASELTAWQNGETGYPIIDAPMRQLRAIGWMPNRARMIVASFLTKHLLVHWLHGDIYFMQHLIDGDTASNNGGWQWASGTGTDAQPYFRIFNPIAQSKKFATTEYLKHWLPELHGTDDKFIHTPWLAPQPPKAYPKPIVDHDRARQRTLTTFKLARGEKNNV